MWALLSSQALSLRHIYFPRLRMVGFTPLSQVNFLCTINSEWVGDGTVGELRQEPTIILLHLALFKTEGIYFMDLLLSHWGTGRKCLLPKRKSLKQRLLNKQTRQGVWTSEAGRGHGCCGHRMETIMTWCKQSDTHTEPFHYQHFHPRLL